MRIKVAVTSSMMISALVLSAIPALGAEPRDDGGDEVAAALERDLGLSPEEAKAQESLQRRALKTDDALRAALGDGYAGSQYELREGALTVFVSDRGLLEKAKELGAQPRYVEYGLRELDAIKAELDARAGGPDGAKERKRTKPVDADFTSWYVDPASNSVHVVVTDRQAAAAKELAAKYGEAVTVEVTDDLPETAANWMDGGDSINGSTCSAGFNLRNPSTGQGYLLTAGHCVNAGSNLSGQGGVNFGPVLESWFPSYDDAIVRKTNNYWIQGPWVDTNPSNGGIVTTTGFTDLPVGYPICKSGITTKWTCGVITAKNQTVNYTGGRTVYGLTRHSACVEPGDSGGANVSVSFGRRAEGVTSGASMISWFGQKYCRAKFGLPNISWYFPIADSLAYYGPKYGVTTW